MALPIQIESKYKISDKLKGIVICKTSGEYLLDLILDSEINPVLLSSFVGALSLFGKDNLGKIEEIIVKGLDVQMIIVTLNDLILISIMDRDFVNEDVREEAAKALNNFYALYKNEINGCINTEKFKSFKILLYSQIKDYFERIEKSDRELNVGDFGFFTQAIQTMRESTN